jgi:hypothetical protein
MNEKSPNSIKLPKSLASAEKPRSHFSVHLRVVCQLVLEII